MTMRRRPLASALALGLAAPAVVAADVTIGKTFVAQSVDPAEGSAGWALVSHGVAEQLFTVDRQGNVVPDLATAIDRDGDGWIVTLDTARTFSDGSPLTADVAAAALTRTSETNPSARATGGALAVTALDEARLRIVPERPVAVMASLLAEWPMAIYRESGEGFVFTGPFAVATFEAGAALELTPNPHYDDEAGRRPDIRLLRFTDAQSLALALQAAELDLAFNLPVEALPRLRDNAEIEVSSFPVAYQYMMWMNTREGALADPAVRGAIALAVDRAMLAEAVGGGEVATGAFASFFPFAAKAPRPHDAEAAQALLEAAGWRDTDGDGVREKDGVDLVLRLHAYPQRPDLVTFQPVVDAQLEAVGIGVDTFVTEAVSELARSQDFDLLLWAQHTAPAGDPAFFLNMFLRTGAANNHSGFANEDYDAVLDRLAVVDAPEARATIALEAQEILFEQAPVTFLLTPSWHYGARGALRDYEIWGSDYYVIRDDLFVE